MATMYQSRTGTYSVRFANGEVISSYFMRTEKDAIRMARNSCARKGQGFVVFLTSTNEVTTVATSLTGVYPFGHTC